MFSTYIFLGRLNISCRPFLPYYLRKGLTPCLWVKKEIYEKNLETAVKSNSILLNIFLHIQIIY